MTKPARISYLIMAVLLVLIASLRLGTLVLTVLFGYFALQKFRFGRSQNFAVVLYVIVVAAAAYGLIHFSRQAYVTLPKIADETIPKIVDYAQSHNIELPFSDYDSLKAIAVERIKEGFSHIGHYAHSVFLQLLMLSIGVVVALSLFLNVRWGEDEETRSCEDSIYATVVRELARRFDSFYSSFSKVIGAQIVISAVNAALTAVFIIWNDFPNKLVLIGLTFLCGLLPIIGNLISNVLIVGVGFAISPRMALISLIFLIAIHKLEYFLNSKIIGDRIKNPMWLTLIGIILGETLMGIPGMILAPVVLHYIKVEASRNKVAECEVQPVPLKEPEHGAKTVESPPPLPKKTRVAS
jgi:predicted PurR-regulated permease PerM